MSSRNRLLDAAKRALSLEGLVGTLIGGGVWFVAAAAFTQITEFTLAASVAAGAGVGLIAVAGFIWLGVIPRRAYEQKRVNVLKSSTRRHLGALAEEGLRKWTGVTLAPSEGRIEWQRRVYSFLLDAFGKETANTVLRAWTRPQPDPDAPRVESRPRRHQAPTRLCGMGRRVAWRFLNTRRPGLTHVRTGGLQTRR